MSFDPTIGRWLQEDPDQFGPADPDLYRYVGNNPTNATDPIGLEPKQTERVPLGGTQYGTWRIEQYNTSILGSAYQSHVKIFLRPIRTQSTRMRYLLCKLFEKVS